MTKYELYSCFFQYAALIIGVCNLGSAKQERCNVKNHRRKGKGKHKNHK